TQKPVYNGSVGVHAPAHASPLKGAAMTLPPEPLYPQNQTIQNNFKRCRCCDLNLPIGAFEKCNRSKNRRATCRLCRRKLKEKSAHNQTISHPITKKFCSKCKTEKPLNEFTKYSQGNHGLHSYCQE